MFYGYVVVTYISLTLLFLTISQQLETLPRAFVFSIAFRAFSLSIPQSILLKYIILDVCVTGTRKYPGTNLFFQILFTLLACLSIEYLRYLYATFQPLGIKPPFNKSPYNKAAVLLNWSSYSPMLLIIFISASILYLLFKITLPKYTIYTDLLLRFISISMTPIGLWLCLFLILYFYSCLYLVFFFFC